MPDFKSREARPADSLAYFSACFDFQALVAIHAGPLWLFGASNMKRRR